MLDDPREISGKEFLADVRAGLGDIGLMRKYEVTRRQFKALLKQLADAGALDPLERLTLEINSKEFVSDVRSGTANAQLMERYRLSQEELEAVRDNLGARGPLTQEDPE
jgi:hypothetical protein